MAARLAPGDDLVGWCALTHDLGKALTPPDVLPRHIGHEQAGLAPLRALAARLRVPAEYLTLAELVCRFHLNIHRAFELRADTLLEMLERIDVFRRPERLDRLLIACEADKRGRLGFADSDYPQAAYVRAAYASAAAVRAEEFVERGLSGSAIGEAVRKARVAALSELRERHLAK
jgi:tRNA nucleotidyltransferase (CCA-adding enzyme)